MSFPVKIGKFKNTYFEEHLRTVSSVHLMNAWYTSGLDLLSRADKMRLEPIIDLYLFLTL